VNGSKGLKAHEVGDSRGGCHPFHGLGAAPNLTRGSAFGSTLGFMLTPAPRASEKNLYNTLLVSGVYGSGPMRRDVTYIPRQFVASVKISDYKLPVVPIKEAHFFNQCDHFSYILSRCHP
jgi:hypothetical protein